MLHITTDHWRRRIAWVLLIAGLGLTVGSVTEWVKAHSFLLSSVRAEGTVVKMMDRKENGKTTYAPVYTFADKHGNVVKVYSPDAASKPAYEVGQKIDVYYSPLNPSQASLPTFFSLWGACIISGGIGLPMFLIGVYGVWKSRRSGEDRKMLRRR